MNSNNNLDLARKAFPYNEDQRVAYMLGLEKGYDQAMQDFMEKAEMYLKTRVYYNMHPNNITTVIQDFKNYMQNEI